jgi:protein-S-isoprenylcysteine O-methyltransferase Ste14
MSSTTTDVTSASRPTEPDANDADVERRKARWARIADVALGLSSLSWAVLGLMHAEGPPMPARIGAAVINATVGVLFLVREPPRIEATNRELLRALPSVVLGAVAWRASGTDWPVPLSIAFLVVALVAAATLATLGRSFAIFPALRTLRTAGPYRLVRHPLYLLEVALVAISASAHAWWAGVALGVLAVATLVPRIADEERVLAADPAHTVYRERVRWRLIPGIY